MPFELAAVDDTDPEALRILIEGYRRMSHAQKAQRISALTRGVQQVALARIRATHPDEDAHTHRLRLASLWLPRETMRAAFGWDPEVEGL